MSVRDPRRTRLSEIHLGDIVTLPGGRDMTVRGKVDLDEPVHHMAGFLICNELEVLLSTPPRPGGPYGVYVPLDYMPHPRAHLRQVAAGAFRYWAPHLPSVSGAMAELLYRVFEVRGSVDPVVVVYRGPELIVFVRESSTTADELDVLEMRRDMDTEADVDRFAAVVDTPAYISEPAPEPARTLFHQFVH